MTDIRDDSPDPAEERITTEGPVYTVTGGDWDTLLDVEHDDRIVINMGPQHPSTHGVLRLVLELEGETVHPGPVGDRVPAHRHREELRVPHLDPGRHVRDAHGLPGADLQRGGLLPRRWRSCSASRRRAGRSVARVLLMELNRIGSHLVCLATGGMELGALTGMTAGFREREEVLHLLEFLTGLRMNHAYVRPGGLAQDFPEGWTRRSPTSSR